jgi:hypothetical protein
LIGPGNVVLPESRPDKEAGHYRLVDIGRVGPAPDPFDAHQRPYDSLHVGFVLVKDFRRGGIVASAHAREQIFERVHFYFAILFAF